MGSMLYNSSKQHTLEDKIAAYKAILEKDFQGTILTGTKSPEHLLENLKAFKAAQKELQI